VTEGVDPIFLSWRHDLRGLRLVGGLIDAQEGSNGQTHMSAAVTILREDL
jgi:hypothetical protein